MLKIPTKAYDEYRKSVKATSRKIYYTVKRGDSLSKISYQYGASIRNIKKWNNKFKFIKYNFIITVRANNWRQK